ncbi:MAG: hypothetical protein ACI4JF_08245, partial [Oscillospiraceae bacterium]
QIYANVSRINRSNHIVNTSLSYQMKYIENKTDSEAHKILYSGSSSSDPSTVPPASTGGGVSTNNNYVSFKSSYSGNTFSCGADIYILMSRKDSGGSDSAVPASEEKDYNLRYRYILGHSN